MPKLKSGFPYTRYLPLVLATRTEYNYSNPPNKSHGIEMHMKSCKGRAHLVTTSANLLLKAAHRRQMATLTKRGIQITSSLRSSYKEGGKFKHYMLDLRRSLKSKAANSNARNCSRKPNNPRSADCYTKMHAGKFKIPCSQGIDLQRASLIIKSVYR